MFRKALLNHLQKSLLSTWALTLLLTVSLAQASQAESDARRPVLITVDDLPIVASASRHPDPEDRLRITEGLMDVFARHQIKAVGLVTWSNVHDDTDLKILERWLEAGHELGNHSNKHLNYTNTDTKTYLADVESARQHLSTFLAERGRELRFFRFPYLREGETSAKLEAMRKWLTDTGQRNMVVTLDNQDWSFAQPWLNAQRAGDQAEMARVAEAFHESLHLSIRHQESVGDSLFDRPVPQILLLHAYALGAAEWDGLFTWMKARGYRFADADEVLADPVFSEPHAFVGPRGFSFWDRLLVKKRHEDARREVEEVIRRQVAAWNRGDLEGFCADYHEDALFAGSTGLTRGRQAVLDRYKKRYPDRPRQGVLTIDVLDFAPGDGTEVSMLGDARPGRVHSATVVGRWTLRYPELPERETASGLTLLVFRREFGRQGKWEIIRDASM